MIRRMIVAVAILFAVLLLMLPSTDEASKKKMASAAMLMCSNDYRQRLAGQLQQDESPMPAFDNSCPELIAAVTLGEDGEMTLHGAQYGIVMVLTPLIEEGEVRWRCRGEPAEAITKLCKP